MVDQTAKQRYARSKGRGPGLRFSQWPVLVYRMRLGWLMGQVFMLVTHRGRRSGIVRQTGVMVLRHDTTTREYLVIAGSPSADWYRNIQATPAIEITIGHEQYRPAQRFLSEDEIIAALAWSRSHNPVAARIQGMFFGWPWGTAKEVLLAIARSVGGVAFSPPSTRE